MEKSVCLPHYAVDGQPWCAAFHHHSLTPLAYCISCLQVSLPPQTGILDQVARQSTLQIRRYCRLPLHLPLPRSGLPYHLCHCPHLTLGTNGPQPTLTIACSCLTLPTASLRTAWTIARWCKQSMHMACSRSASALQEFESVLPHPMLDWYMRFRYETRNGTIVTVGRRKG